MQLKRRMVAYDILRFRIAPVSSPRLALISASRRRTQIVGIDGDSGIPVFLCYLQTGFRSVRRPELRRPVKTKALGL